MSDGVGVGLERRGSDGIVDGVGCYLCGYEVFRSGLGYSSECEYCSLYETFSSSKPQLQPHDSSFVGTCILCLEY